MKSQKYNLIGKFKSIQTAIYLMMSMMVLSAIGLLTMISMQYTKATVFENTVMYTGQLTSQVNHDIDSYINYMENISGMLAGNTDVQNFIFGEEEVSAEAEKQVQAQFDTVINSRSDIYNIGIVKDDGRMLVNNSDTKVNPYINIKKLEWYQKAVEHPEQIYLSSAHVQHIVEGKRPWVITLSRFIPNQDNSQDGCVLFVDLNYSAIRTLCDASSVGEKGYIFILDDQGNIVYHPQQQQLYNELQTEHIDEVRNCEKKYLELGKGKDARLYTISKSEKTGWIVVGCSLHAELLKRSNQAQQIYLIIAIVLVVVALFISSVIAKNITRPIQKLQTSMKFVEEGNFQAGNVEVESKNEIGCLTESFNAMTGRIQELMEQNVEEQKAKRKSELKALQSQINPHFLYNTLDSIIWMAEGNKKDEVVLMTASLARLLRHNISNEEEENSIAQEIEYCKNYLTIQKMRYQDKLEYDICVEPELKNHKIIKLVLQPLIENAIYHGLKYKESKGFLMIRGYEQGQTIIFEIEDNGVGMSQEVLEHIFESHKVNYRSNGVGVYNVQKRIKLTYGQEYGVSYRSVLGEGTVATVVIPKERRTGHES